jgi:hypothetical protein
VPEHPDASPRLDSRAALPDALLPPAPCCCTCPHAPAVDARLRMLPCLLRMLLLHANACAQFLSRKQTRMARVSSNAWSPKHGSCNRSLSWTPAISTRFSSTLHAPAAHACMCMLACLRTSCFCACTRDRHRLLSFPMAANVNTCNMKHLLQHTFEIGETFKTYTYNICV